MMALRNPSRRITPRVASKTRSPSSLVSTSSKGDKETDDYLSNSAMARLTDVRIIKVAHYKRLQIFQLILNLIEEAVVIVGASTEIDTIHENYTNMMKVSEKALNHLKGASNNAGEPSRLKRLKSVEVPKFDVNKPGMQTFLNSMELLSKSYVNSTLTRT
jgi:hypothetical protein